MTERYDAKDYETWRERKEAERAKHYGYPHGKKEPEEVIDDGQYSITDQESDEVIIIKKSCNIDVVTTDTQAAVNLQAALEFAIVLVVSITVGDTDRGNKIAQDLFQKVKVEQRNKQKIVIYNSKDVEVTTTDTDIAVNVQALLQVLLAIVARLDVL